MQNTKLKKTLRAIADNGVNLILISILTGLFAGVVVTFYNILANLGEDTAAKLYALLIDNPVFIPLLFVGLAAGAVVIGTLVRFVPMIRGSGIPQIEGAARGIVRFKWYVTMCSMFAASLACVFMGLSAGAEGPSLQIGGCAGEAVGVTLKRTQMVRRLQIASGSSAGLAVAFNAPITGLVFAMEEAFRSFSPQVFICAAISVITALFTRNLIRPAIGFGTGFAFDSFTFTEFSLGSCLWAIPAAIVTALAGVGFYYAVFAAKKLFKNVNHLKGTLKFIIVFIIAGDFALITAYAIGGGHSFIDALASPTGAISVEKVFGLSVAASLVIIVIIRFIAAVMNMGCGVPCGVFIPMLAVGAGIGALLSLLFQKMGMNGAYSDYLVIICMSVFFTTVVKAPITGVVMVFELTGQFTNFLPAMLGIAVGYLIGMLFRTQPIYERNLEEFIEAEKFNLNMKKERVSVVIKSGSKADGAKVRAVIWPTNGLVVEIAEPDGKVIVPDGETVMQAGSTLVFECETVSRAELLDYLTAIVGKQE
ncbi:MAG: ClC family H(+)/Cl(-) exchange transporter [Clostridia bacterium]|nr:ClC family H(+)/Cl(-) exchange transporter [Clostridia bacterium]